MEGAVDETYKLTCFYELDGHPHRITFEGSKRLDVARALLAFKAEMREQHGEKFRPVGDLVGSLQGVAA